MLKPFVARPLKVILSTFLGTIKNLRAHKKRPLAKPCLRIKTALSKCKLLNGLDDKHILDLGLGGDAAVVGVHGSGRSVVSRHT